MNSTFENLSRGDLQIIELHDSPETIMESRKILAQYGDYLFNELKLNAGKEAFFTELKHFPGDKYKPPSGTFILAKLDDKVVGCVGIKKFDMNRCEMKRMYILPSFRGKGLGKTLCNFVINWCRGSMYHEILLDTNLEMKDAFNLYLKCGFIEIPPYCINENANPIFMKYSL